jgi:NAD(P)-dependent dehydrogenase (short-subunit alcohol dehydrogenase family)
MDGKVALVSGGASGIGAASCRLMAREGAKVVVADLKAEAGEALAAELGDAAVFQPLDVRLEESWRAATAAAMQAFGKLNVVVNNAGIGFPIGDVEHQSLEDWRAMMAVNSDGVFLGVKHGIAAIRRCGEPGSIVNMSSIMGLVGMAASAAYTASKGSVRLLTKSAALYCARERLPIRVNSVHPGYIRTDMVTTTLSRTNDYEGRLRQVEAATPMGHIGEPEDIANGVLFLACDESRYMTGAELVIDGGFTAQ